MTAANESQSSEAARSRHPVREGEVVAGKYRIERLIGVGGMGAVFAAIHIALEQRVALKFLTLRTDNTEVQQRFTRESRAAAKIQSEHVGRVFDVGELESGVPFFVMEYLEGKDLLDVLEADGPIPVERAVTYVLQACEAIAEAHAAGVVHRDLKPANLFLARRAGGPAIIKVLDFGISKMTAQSGEPGEKGITRASRVSMSRRSVQGGADPGLTAPTSMLGSPLYMSPEQLSSAQQVDARTDIWSLGIILYELCTGNVPFNEATMPLIYVAILEKPAPLLRTVLPAAPAALEAVIARCLSKDPLSRYRDVIELIDALAKIAPKQGEISAARVASLSRVPELEAPIVSGKTVLRDAPTIGGWGQNKARPSGRKRTPLLIGLSLVVLAVAALGVRSWVRSNTATVTQAAPPEMHEPAPEPPRDLAKSADPAETAPPTAASTVAAVAEPPATGAPAAGSSAPSAVPVVTPTGSLPAAPPTVVPRTVPAGSPPGLATTRVSRAPKGSPTADPPSTGKPPDKGTTGFGDRE